MSAPSGGSSSGGSSSGGAAPEAAKPGGVMAVPHELMAVLRGSTPNHLHLRERLVVLVGSVLVLDAVSSVLAWWFERDAPRSDIHHYGDALFWTTTQLITVSSQMRNPVTGPGMVLDVVIEFAGITIVAALAGSLGSFLYRRSMERNPHSRHV